MTPDVQTTEARALELLARLYIMCCQAGDFSNGVTYHSLDEGQVKADQFLGRVAGFLRGRSPDYDEYASDFVTANDLPF